jgi:hypothetical protein
MQKGSNANDVAVYRQANGSHTRKRLPQIQSAAGARHLSNRMQCA